MRSRRRYSLQRALSTLVLTGLLCIQGCAWKGEGLVESGALGAHLQVSTGERWKLVYGADQRVLAHLDGEIVVVEGSRLFKNLKVKRFSIPTGRHGMPVWFGRLEQRGVQLGLEDRNNGGYYLLRDAGSLRDHVGASVLVEGYVDGPHRIRVLFSTVLQ